MLKVFGSESGSPHRPVKLAKRAFPRPVLTGEAPSEKVCALSGSWAIDVTLWQCLMPLERLAGIAPNLGFTRTGHRRFGPPRDIALRAVKRVGTCRIGPIPRDSTLLEGRAITHEISVCQIVAQGIPGRHVAVAAKALRQRSACIGNVAAMRGIVDPHIVPDVHVGVVE